MIEIASSKVEDFDKGVAFELSSLNNKGIKIISLKNRIYLLTIMSSLDIEIEALSTPPIKGNELTIDLVKQYNMGNISKELFFEKIKDAYFEEQVNLVIENNQRAINLEKTIEKGTPWRFIKRLFVVLEVFLVVLSLLGYYYLYCHIKKRAYKKTSG